MDDRTTARPVGPAAGWWWGTNRPGGTFYAARAHVVHPAQPASGLCGLPVDDVWELRPPTPEHLCPDCCVLAMAASYPPFPPSPAPPLPRRAASTDRPVPAAEALTEQTASMPALEADDDPRDPSQGESPTQVLPAVRDFDDPTDDLTAVPDDTAVVRAAAVDALRNPRRTDAALLQQVLDGLRRL